MFKICFQSEVKYNNPFISADFGKLKWFSNQKNHIILVHEVLNHTKIYMYYKNYKVRIIILNT